jgi:hypothetical protein
MIEMWLAREPPSSGVPLPPHPVEASREASPRALARRSFGGSLSALNQAVTSPIRATEPTRVRRER